MRFVDLTHPLCDGQPVFPSDPPLRITWHGTIEGLRYNLSELCLGSHQGTHVDAMRHFVADGRAIDELPLDWLFGPARVIRIPKQAGDEITPDDLAPFERFLTPGARILYETGWHREFGTDQFYADPPSLTQDAARYLASRQLRLLGMDTPTPGRDYYEIHHILLARPVEMVVVETLANLHALPDTFTFAAFPLRLAGRDGSPVRAVAIVE